MADELTDDEVARWEPGVAQWYVSSWASPLDYEYPPTRAQFRRDRAMTRAVRRALRAYAQGDPIPSYPNDPEKQGLVRNVVKVAQHFDIDVRSYIEPLDPAEWEDPTSRGRLAAFEEMWRQLRAKGQEMTDADREELQDLRREAGLDVE